MPQIKNKIFKKLNTQIMKQSEKSLSGKIIDKKTKKGLFKLRVEVWKRNSNALHLLGASITDQEGQFAIKLESALVPKLRQAKTPQIFYRIYQGDRLLYKTPPNGSANGKPGMAATISIDSPGADNGYYQWQINLERLLQNKYLISHK